MILYKVAAQATQATPFNCQPFQDTLNPADGNPLVISQKKDDLITLPQGVAFTLDPNQMVRLEMHYINANPSQSATLVTTSTLTTIPDSAYQVRRFVPLHRRSGHLDPAAGDLHPRARLLPGAGGVRELELLRDYRPRAPVRDQGADLVRNEREHARIAHLHEYVLERSGHHGVHAALPRRHQRRLPVPVRLGQHIDEHGHASARARARTRCASSGRTTTRPIHRARRFASTRARPGARVPMRAARAAPSARRSAAESPSSRLASYTTPVPPARLEDTTKRVEQWIDRLLREENIAHDGVDRACHRDDRLPLGFERGPHGCERGPHGCEPGAHGFE